MEKKKKTILLFFISLLVVSLLIKSYPVVTSSKKIALNLSRFPLKLFNLSFLPAQALIKCNRSLSEVSILKEENQKLKVRLMQLEEAESENERLKKSLSFKERSKFSLVAARVISFDASNLRRSLVIDKGKNQRIKIGSPVISPEGIVGIVVEVGNSSSRIILVNDLDFSMAAKVKRSNVTGVISGSLEGMCKLKYLDLDDDIQVGDEVISSGKNSRFPAGITAGKVVEISKEHSGLTLFAIVKPKVKLSSLEEVLVIVNY